MDLIINRLNLGKQKYGHGVRVNDDTVTWGTPKDSWLEMAKEEFLDGVIYLIADYIRNKRKNGEIGPMIGDDDNKLILNTLENITEMDNCIHKVHIKNLLNMINSC